MGEDDPTTRTLRLLALLQSRPRWAAHELADRLQVSPRTLRRDIARLQALDYRVESRPGPGGHYALSAGTRMPPLLFDDKEVLALIAGLRMIEDRLSDDAAASALAKLRQVLPRRLASVAEAATRGTESVRRRAPDLDLATLGALFVASTEDRTVDFAYRDREGRPSSRRTDSVLCVQSRGEWYLIGFDLDRADWRAFRVDRLSEVRTGARVPRRERPWTSLRAWLTSDFGRRATSTGDQGRRT